MFPSSAGSVGFTRRAGGGRVTHPSVHALLAEAPLLAASVHAQPADGGPPPTSALVFGREESGLEDSELSLCTYACAIPTGRALPSHNLSHAVAAVLSRLFELALGRQGGVDALDPGAQPCCCCCFHRAAWELKTVPCS